MPRKRLDEILLERGLTDSRSRAKALILAGRVRSGTEILDKAGKSHPDDIPLEVMAGPRYVSRGGEKLAAALDAFAFDPSGLDILDLGASTGGFTDCLLQRGAAAATCVDVGRAQLHGKLRADPRVVNIEQCNVRHLDNVQLPRQTYPLVVMDLSFISLRLVLEPAWNRLCPGGCLIALVKPQFEATREEAGRGRGVIRDPDIQQRCLHEVRDFALRRLPAAICLGAIESPIAGADGNREFLLVLRQERAEGAF